MNDTPGLFDPTLTLATPLIVFAIVMAVLLFFFWIAMLIDVAGRDFPQADERTLWLIITLVFGPIGALIYCCTGRRRGDGGKQVTERIDVQPKPDQERSDMIMVKTPSASHKPDSPQVNTEDEQPGSNG